MEKIKKIASNVCIAAMCIVGTFVCIFALFKYFSGTQDD